MEEEKHRKEKTPYIEATYSSHPKTHIPFPHSALRGTYIPSRCFSFPVHESFLSIVPSGYHFEDVLLLRIYDTLG
jgi:hypothetical protein